jgi:hypothetical protein
VGKITFITVVKLPIWLALPRSLKPHLLRLQPKAFPRMAAILEYQPELARWHF